MRIYAIMQPEPYKISFCVGKTYIDFSNILISLLYFGNPAFGTTLKLKGLTRLHLLSPFFVDRCAIYPLNLIHVKLADFP